MKNLFILLSVFWSLSAVGASDQKGYFSISSGMGFYLYEVGEFSSSLMEIDNDNPIISQDLVYKFGLEYGTHLVSRDGYIGLFGIGISNYSLGTFLFHLKYGYEFMREGQISLGLDASMLFGSKGITISDLLIGGAIGVNGKITITRSIAAVIRVVGEFIQTFDGTYARGYPAFDASIRWYL